MRKLVLGIQAQLCGKNYEATDAAGGPEESLKERGVKVDHVTLNRKVIRYSSSLVMAAKSKPKVRLILIQDEISSK